MEIEKEVLSVVVTFAALFATGIAGTLVTLFSRLTEKDEAKVKNIEGAIKKVTSDNSNQAISKADPDQSKSGLHVTGDGNVIYHGGFDEAKWGLVEDLVNGYHRQALTQAMVQFWFAIGAATVGFALIVYTFAVASQSSGSETFWRLLPGFTIDAVAALFFRQAEATRERATALYDRLRADNQRAQALGVVDSIPDEGVRSVVRAQIAAHIAGIDSPSLDLNSLLPRRTNKGDIEIRQ